MAKLAAFDMDGTLLMPDHRLGERTLTALRRLQQSGVTVTFATGRHALEMRHLIDTLGFDAFLISGNGTRIHSRSGEVLHRCDLEPAVAEATIHGFRDSRISMHVFNDEGWFTDYAQPAMLAAHRFSGFQYQLRPTRQIPAHEVTKICFCGDSQDLIRLRIQLNELFSGRAHLCFSATDCLEVLPPGCSKGSALAMLCEYLGVDMADCMAFGDAMNDSEMLGMVGKGLIMENAMPQLKAVLPHLPVIGHCRNQAVSHYLTHWLDTPHLPYSPE